MKPLLVSSTVLLCALAILGGCGPGFTEETGASPALVDGGGSGDPDGSDSSLLEAGVCPAGTAHCSGDPRTGCETQLDDPKHCGSCMHDCTRLAHVSGATTCSAGKCVVPSSSCSVGFAHCSSNVDDGCEADLGTPATCGACTNACTAGPANSTKTCTSGVCGWECRSGYTLCGGACVNLNSDGKHCGVCDHDCLGGGCSGGQCNPVVLGLFPPNSYGQGMAVGGGAVYLTSDGASPSLYKCSVAGCPGTLTPLASLASDGTDLYIDQATGYLFDAQYQHGLIEGVVERRDLSTASTLSSVGGQQFAHGFVTDATYVYWSSGQTVWRAPKDTLASPTAVATGLDAVAFALDPVANVLYIVNGGATTGHIEKCPLAGGGCGSSWSDLTPVGQAYPVRVAVLGSTVFWTVSDSVNPSHSNGGLFSCPTSGCSSPTALATGTTYASGNALTADASSVYFAAGLGVFRCAAPSCAGGPTRIGDGGSTYAMANDATAVFWTLNSVIYKVAK